VTSVLDEVMKIVHRYHVDSLYVFGSRAAEISARVHGQSAVCEHPDSDVDIAIQPSRNHRLSARERVRLAGALEDLFDVGRVDLVLLPEANPFLAVEAIRGEMLACRDLDTQAEDELYILRRAGDLAPFERQRWEQLIEARTT
jgi:predicted nucleotidyltransferase